MIDSAATGEVAVNPRPAVVEKLRRLGQLGKDAKGEFYETTFGGAYNMGNERSQMASKNLKFYLGHAMRLPLEWAKALTGFGGDGSHGNGRVIEAEEVCMQCKGKGQNNLGRCQECRGAKWIKTGAMYHIFVMVSTDDPTAFDTNEIPMRKLETKTEEAAAALA